MKVTSLDPPRPGSADVVPREERPVRRRAGRLVGWAIAHPVLAVGAVALGVRLLVAIASFVLNSRYFVGDELQYIQLARAVAGGRGAESWFPGYGQSLYNSTHVFVAPITFLFKYVVASRIVAQFYVVLFGAAVAALLTRLALEVVLRKWALIIGLSAALFPSQILWSSIVLRESLVWASLVAIALGVAIGLGARGWKIVAAVGGVVVALLFLGALREQTMVVAAWALVPAAFVGATHARWRRTAGALAVAIVVPAIAGLGWLGWDLVERAVPSLAHTRANQAYAADSAFSATTVIPGTTTTTPLREAIANRPRITNDATSPPPPVTTTTLPEGLQALLVDSGGNIIAVDESLDGSLHALPTGLLATVFRPLPWEATVSEGSTFARVENLAWYLLYVLAAIGLVRSGRRHRRVLAYPFFVTGLVVAVAAVTQGNLGTAFRHRGQVFWALAIIAGVHLADHFGGTRAGPPGASGCASEGIQIARHRH